MFRRILLLAAGLGVFAALTATGVSAKDGFKTTFVFDSIPGITQAPLEFNCNVTIEGKIAYLDCHIAAPNPTPPKDVKTATEADGPNRLKATGYPDGEVVVTGRVKAAVFAAT